MSAHLSSPSTFQSNATLVLKIKGQLMTELGSLPQDSAAHFAIRDRKSVVRHGKAACLFGEEYDFLSASRDEEIGLHSSSLARAHDSSVALMVGEPLWLHSGIRVALTVQVAKDVDYQAVKVALLEVILGSGIKLEDPFFLQQIFFDTYRESGPHDFIAKLREKLLVPANTIPQNRLFLTGYDVYAVAPNNCGVEIFFRYKLDRTQCDSLHQVLNRSWANATAGDFATLNGSCPWSGDLTSLAEQDFLQLLQRELPQDSDVLVLPRVATSNPEHYEI